MAEIERLYKGYRPTLRNPQMRETFDVLIRVWRKESLAMMMSNFPLSLDAINHLANVHIRAELEQLEAKFKKLLDIASFVS